MKPHKHCELIHAYAEGAEIQRLYSDGSWHDIEHPQFLPGNTYRIKPRTVKREGWVNIGKFHEGYFTMSSGEVFGSEKAALRYAAGSITTVKVEWEEEE